ncbi:MAG: undecaprenyl-phosphate galactose phosphotransferase WbaP [Spirochaetaceae bacterium]|jgi:Undecaprenyl-phosphate galactose phosphotransferase WbaP|nr:undecaprenyl-phosphate galactose phosphotransferase WbaP [Spirochaetaceae bacterium]
MLYKMDARPNAEITILKRNASSLVSGLAILCVDVLSIMLCFGTSFFIINFIDHTLINFRSFITYWVYLPVFLLVFYGAKLYPGIMLPPADEVRRVSLCSLCLFAGIALSIEVETDNRTALSLALVLAVPIAIILIPAMREIARHFFSRFSWWGVGIVVYCNGSEGYNVIDRLLRNPDLGYQPVLIVNTGRDGDRLYRNIPILPPNASTHTLIKKYGYKSAIIVESPVIDMRESELDSIIMNLYRYTTLIPHTNMYTTAIAVRDLGGMLGFASTHNLTKRANLLIKRIIDVLVCIVFSPLILLITLTTAALIKLTSPGPVFYGQPRIGQFGREFKAWKFRSMVQNADALLKEVLERDPQAKSQWEEKQKLDNDPRITKLGKFLRRSSIDEIPQLWNIFLGEMSLVGPRPHPAFEFKQRFSAYKSQTDYLLSVTPGLSGLWQVSGRSETNYEERIALDSYYIQNWSIWLDIWVLIKTFGAVLAKRGAV